MGVYDRATDIDWLEGRVRRTKGDGKEEKSRFVKKEKEKPENPSGKRDGLNGVGDIIREKELGTGGAIAEHARVRKARAKLS
jgi:hypothetical protein